MDGSPKRGGSPKNSSTSGGSPNMGGSPNKRTAALPNSVAYRAGTDSEDDITSLASMSPKHLGSPTSQTRASLVPKGTWHRGSTSRVVAFSSSNEMSAHAPRNSRGSAGTINGLLLGMEDSLVEDNEKPRERWYRSCSRNLADSTKFMAFTTVLTIYALVGDDLRLIFTNQPVDTYFDAVVIGCFSIFALEIVVSCLGKADYICSFFFFLDIIATASMILDLTFVADGSLFSGGSTEQDNASNLRGGRTAKVGAKFARLIRILRLIRIFKLYQKWDEARKREEKRRRKAARQAKIEAKKQMEQAKEDTPKLPKSCSSNNLAALATFGQGEALRSDTPTKLDALMKVATKKFHGGSAQSPQVEPGFLHDDWDEDFDEDEEENGNKLESKIGQKMSDMTIRRTICLILTMLVFLPLMVHEEANLNSFSAEYGADHVWSAFEEAFQEDFYTTNNSWSAGSASRTTYEEALLKMVYYHNWFKEGDPSSHNFYSQLYWVGVQGMKEDKVTSKATAAKVRQDTLSTFQSRTASLKDRPLYSYGGMPAQVQETLRSDWTQNCDSIGKQTSWYRRGFSVLSKEISGSDVVGYLVQCPRPLKGVSHLRFQESTFYFPRSLTDTEYDSAHIAFYFDLRPFVREESRLGLCNTGFVIVLLLLWSVLFSRDANHLVVHPLERMMERVLTIRSNPMTAIKMSDDEFRAEERAKAAALKNNKDKVKHLKAFAKDLFSGKNKAVDILETVILEKTIIKLGTLLVLGFGQAGSNIIVHNLHGGASAGVDAMVPGAQVECIIGVARVMDFSTATEVLQGKITTFVNQIAEIVHGVANEFHGAPNRNSGDCFLIVWKVTDVYWTDVEDPSMNEEETARMAEMSVAAFATMVGALHSSPLLADYRRHPGLQLRLGADHRVDMSFGLHSGWAIEGAVGSEFKIDASYLSPNVSIAQSMQRMALMYDVRLLLSQTVVDQCGKEVASKCRRIDKVIITGSQTPMELYCVDLDYRSVEVDHQKPLDVVWNSRTRYSARQQLEQSQNVVLEKTFEIGEVFEKDEVIAQMRKRYTVEFFQLFNMGYQNYSQGEWQVARRMLSMSKKMLQIVDGPSAELLRYMEESDFEAPADWKGVREAVDF